MTNPYLLLVVGLALTWAGAELLVRGSSRLALTLGVRPLVVGLTVVALGTSSPEAVVSFLAAWANSGSVALGNVLGSNIANIGLILGSLALLQPLPIRWGSIRLDVYLMLAATALTALLGIVGGARLSLVDGLLLLAFFLSYIAYYIFTGHEPGSADRDLEQQVGRRRGIAREGLITLVGLGMLLLGARQFLGAATRIATAHGIPDAVVGGTILAVGTSLPELAASAVAVFRKQYDLAVGNIVGSNVLNLAFVLDGVATLAGIHGQSIDVRVKGGSDLFLLMLVFTGALLVLIRISTKLGRVAGASLLLGYLAFVLYSYRG